MNGEQKSLEKTLSLMGMDPLDDETRKKLNGMMRQAIQADATETAPAKYMVVSGLTSYCVGAWLFSLSGDWNALFAVGGVMAVLSAGFILYDERIAKKTRQGKSASGNRTVGTYGKNDGFLFGTPARHRYAQPPS